MGHREMKRVPMDFDHPLHEIWKGYLCPDELETDEEIEAWFNNKKYDPPTGDGYQLWETTTEGSPTSPVFASDEELARWCAEHASVFADIKTPYESWLKMFREDSLGIGTLGIMGPGIQGIDAVCNTEETQ